MAEPLIDVVVATNRRSPYLTAALASVVAQTYPHWRLILVGDGCPDPDFLRAAAEVVPGSVVVMQPSRGVSAARNTGFAAGSGDLVAVLDDDDVWAPGKLAAQVVALQSSPQTVGCYTAGWYLGPDGTTFGSGWPAAPATRADFLSGAVPTPRIVSLVVRRSAWAAVGGFDTTYTMAEDNEFILRLVEHGELACVPEPLVGYRRHSFNTSVAGGLRERIANRRVLREHVRAARRRGDLSTAELLMRKTALHREEWAEETVRGVASAGRRGDLLSGFRQLAWGMTVTPFWTTRVAARKLKSHLTGQHRLGR